MEEGIDTGEFKSLRREKGIWFGDLNRVEFLAVGQVFFFIFLIFWGSLIPQKSISFPFFL